MLATHSNSANSLLTADELLLVSICDGRSFMAQTIDAICRKGNSTYLVQVDNWLPEVVALLVEVSHTDLSEVTWMVLIHVGSVVMLSTCKTTSTGMLAVLSYTTVTGGNVSATVE